MNTALEKADAAHDFPHNTCPASRHAQMIGEQLVANDCQMVADDPKHCGESILATVAALYEARTEGKRLTATIEAQAAEIERLRVAIKSCKTGGYRDIDGDFRKTWWFDEKLVSAAIAKEKTS